MGLGIKSKPAHRAVYTGRKSWWALGAAREMALKNSLWEERGMVDTGAQVQVASTTHGRPCGAAICGAGMGIVEVI